MDYEHFVVAAARVVEFVGVAVLLLGALLAAAAFSRRLVRGEVRLHRHERIARSDGVVTGAERLRLQRNANRMSKRIYVQKHDPQPRPRSW